MKVYREAAVPRGQVQMFPATLDEYVPVGCEVRVVSDMIDSLDLSALYSGHSGGGRPRYEPSLLCKLMVFAYSKRIRSSRRIVEALENDVRFMWLSEGERPDYRTLCRFRVEHEETFKALFRETVRLCAGLGLVLLEQVAVDGTKIEANASKEAVHYKKTVDSQLQKVERQIERILKEAEAADAADDLQFGDASGNEMPEELRTYEGRKAAIARAKREMEESGRSCVVETDKEARVMRTSRGIRPAYNAQAAVDGASQVIVAEEVVQDERDTRQLRAVVEQVGENTGALPGRLTADAGYHAKETQDYVKARGLDAYIPPPRPSAKVQTLRDEMEYDEEADAYRHKDGRVFAFDQVQKKEGKVYRVYRCGHNTFSRRLDDEEETRMRQKLQTQEGRAIFALRRQTVEPVFGRLKENLGLRRLLLRGLSGAKIEFRLSCIAHNLMKAQKAWAMQAATV